MSQFPPRAFIRMAAEINNAERHQGQSVPEIPPTTEGMRFLSLRDVLGRLTISRSLLYELIKDPIQPFPAPLHIGRRSVWVEEEVESYMQAVLQTARQRRAN
ncbi:MAG: helix-turn-helix transcriptional regulator [Hyphomonas sp.]